MDHSADISGGKDPGDKDSGVTIRVDATAVRVVLDRPQRGNALGPATLDALHDALTAAEHDPAISAIVFEGRGTAFCAGADVTAVAAIIDDTAKVEAFFERGRSLMDRLANGPVVSIAAVDGLAAAGGLELVLACDVVLASAAARFVDGHVRYGFVPAFGATARLPERLGRQPAAWLLLADGELSADDAYRLGLVAQLSAGTHELGRLVDTVLERIGRQDQRAQAIVKDLLRANREAPGVERERAAVTEYLGNGGYRPTAPRRSDSTDQA